MLHQSTTNDKDPSLPSLHGLIVDTTDVLHDIQHKAWPLVVVEVQHVANGAIGDGRGEDRNVVEVGPVANRCGVVDFLPKAMDHLGGTPHNSILLLLVMHAVQDWHQPVLKETIVVVRSQQVAYSVEAPGTQISPRQSKVSQVCGSEAFDDVLLNASSSSDHDLHHAVLHQEADGFTHTTTDHIGGVGEPNLGADFPPGLHIFKFIHLILWHRIICQGPVEHSLNFHHGLAHVGGLEACGDKGLKQGFIVHSLVEVIAHHFW